MLENRWKYKIFAHFRLAVVSNRVEYLDDLIVDQISKHSRRQKLFIEWARSIYVEKIIKQQAIEALNHSQKYNSQTLSRMTSVEITEYFVELKQEAHEKLVSELEPLKAERQHYLKFIKHEFAALPHAINQKYPIEVKLETQTYFERHKIAQIDHEETFCSLHDHLSLTPEKLQKRRRNLSGCKSKDFVQLLKSQGSRKHSNERGWKPEPKDMYSTEDLEKSILEKQAIHRSFHNFRASTLVSSQSPRHSSQNEYRVKKVNLVDVP